MKALLPTVQSVDCPKWRGKWLGRVDADPLLVVLLGGMHCYIEKQSFSLSEAL